MVDKYNLTQKQNIFIAKKALVQTIYESGKLEGVNVTFPQTQAILDGYVEGVSTSDVETILNLRNAWRFVLGHIGDTLDLEYIEKINGFVSYQESLEWGVLRTGGIGISGVDYRPPVPVEAQVVSDLDTILNGGESATEQAINLMLWGMRSQLFWDGNKRTATIAANKWMISHGKGIISVPEKNLSEYSSLLSAFYESGDKEEISTFLYDKCVGAFGFEPGKAEIESEEELTR